MGTEPKRDAPLPWRIAEARSNAVYIEDANGATVVRIVYPDSALDIAVDLLRAVNGEAVCDQEIVRLRTQLEAERLHATQIHTGCHAERDELVTRERALREALRSALGIIDWMSGSSHFSPGGAAYQGWLTARADIDKARALVEDARGLDRDP